MGRMHFWDNSLRFRPNLSGSLFYKEFHALNYICHISIFDNLVWSLLGDRRWSFINLAWSLWGEGKASFMRWEKNFIPIKLTWHDYLVPIFGNCALFAFASRDHYEEREEFHGMREEFYSHKTHMTRLPNSYFWKLCNLRLREPFDCSSNGS